MDQELETLIKERYQLLPEEVKRAFKALPIEATMQEIAQKNGLHVDQVGDLYTETALVMLGVEKVGDFKKNIQSNLHVSSALAENILNDVNQKIFLSIRQFLQAIEEVHKNTGIEDNSEEMVSRENILSEIENPPPTVHPISIADQTVAGAAKPREIVTETKVKPADAVAKEFIEGKLTETVSLPSKKYNVDPYRESVN